VVRAYFRHAARFTRPARLFLLAEAIYGVGQTAVWVLRNLYLKACGFEEDFIGLTLAVQSLGMGIVVVAAGPWMDRMRFRPFQVAGVVALAAGLVGVTLHRSHAGVLAACFVSGLGLALLDVGSAPFLVRHSSAEERPYLFGVATALSPASGLVATLGIKAGALAWGEHDASYGRMLLLAAGITAAALAALALVREVAPEPAPREGDPFDWRSAFRFSLPELAFGLGAGLTIPFINLYFRNRFHIPAGDIGLYYSAAQALMMVAFLLAPVVAARLGSVRTIVIFQLSSIPFFLLLAFTTSPGIAVAAFLLRHACMNMIHPVGAHFAMEVIHPRQRARVNGLKQAANKLSWVVANFAGGRLVERGALFPAAVDGFTTTMLITIVLYVAGSAMYWRFFGREPAGRVPTPEGEPAPGA
jgi:MFS family permease